MLIRRPDFYDDFHCLAGACPHSCCEKWEVVLDEDTAERYRTVSGALGEKLRQAMERDEEGDVCFALRGGRCPFLDEENLCEIHRQLGEAATSETCRSHPRFIEDYGPFQEVTLSASCPAVDRLLLGSTAPLGFLELQTQEEGEAGDPWLEGLVPLRDAMLDMLRERQYPLRRRLGNLLALAEEAQNLLDGEMTEALGVLARNWMWQERDAISPESGVVGSYLLWLGELETLEPDWKDLLAQAARSAPAQGEGQEALLERIAVYLAFRYLLKCVNDGDLLTRTRFVVLSVLGIERLAALCGLEEALRRFSCEVEHSEDNLERICTCLQEEALLPWLLSEEG